MQIYLPIAGMSVNILVVLGMGGTVGFLSGMFGVGGNFLLTPLLFFIGIPPAVAVASGANQVVASSVSGMLAHWRRGNVDFKMGAVLLVGGLAGSGVGVWLYTVLRASGQIDLTIRLTYVVFLGAIGVLMLQESLRAMWGKRGRRAKRHRHFWAHGLPLKMRFRRSMLYTSVLPPLAVGFVVGLLSAVMGVGGGFIMVPAMIYIIGMPTNVMVGTSLFQIAIVAANVTILQAVANQTVDLVLALLLMVGGVIGAQFGARAGAKFRGEQLRGLLALVVLAVGGRIAYDLVARPTDLFSLAAMVAP